MEQRRNATGEPFDESAIMDDVKDPDEQGSADAMSRTLGRSPLAKTRSYSDGGGTPSKLSPSPHIIEASRRTSKDDSNIRDVPAPVTPRRLDFTPRGLALQMPPREFTPSPAASNAYVKPAPLSPKLDHSQIYASPILPRRSRGLDFSRSATSLHHSTLAEQSSLDSSPTLGGRAMNIPGRRNEYAGPEQTSTSLWSVMGNQEKMNVSSSLGSAQAIGSDSASSSDDDDLMDEDMDEAYVTTPQVSRVAPPMGQLPPGPFGSPAMSSLMSFQQRQRPRRQAKKKIRGPLGLGFSSTAASLSRSPPSNAAHARRESISWAANQLHISAEGEESRTMNEVDGAPPDGQRNVIRRVVTRRGNMLPKTRTFARIRAALLEEGAPAEAETRREAEVVKQVRESDMDLEPRIPQTTQESTQTTTAPSSPNLTQQEPLDVTEDDMMGEIARDLSSSFKQHAMKNSKGKTFWDTFSEASSAGARTTPPPAAFLPRGSSSGISEDVAMDSPSMAGPANNGPQPPSAAEITRRINSKRRRGDDDVFDPISFKRRAVSPGMSVHNSPVMQSPLQRDAAPWGSRPGSNGGDKGGSSAPSESGSTPGHVSGGSQAGAGGRLNSKGRVGFQGMIDTNDGIMRMSIE